MKQNVQRLPVRRSGYTLPELMAVVAIVGILATLTTTSLTRRTRSDAAAGLARGVYTRLVQARFAAISTGSRVQVHLTPGETVAPLELRTALRPGMAPPPPGDGFGPVTDQLSGRGMAQIIAVVDGVDPVGPPPPPTAEAWLTFYPDGRAQLDGGTASAGATVYLVDAQHEYPRRVVIIGRTGFVRILDH